MYDGSERDQIAFNCVFVVELLLPSDEKTGAVLVREVLGPLATSGAGVVPFHVSLEHNHELLPALRRIVDRVRNEQLDPVLHLETHGSPVGMGRPDEPIVPWSELAGVLRDMNLATRHSLLVTTAACHGAFLVSTMHPSERAPFWGVIGPTTQVLPTDIRKGYRAFFADLMISGDLQSSLEALKRSGVSYEDGWRLLAAEMLFALVFGKYLVTQAGPGSLRARERRVVSKLRREQHGGQRIPKGIRRGVRRHLQDSEVAFRRTKQQFFSIDHFPEHEERYPLTLEACLKLYERTRVF